MVSLNNLLSIKYTRRNLILLSAPELGSLEDVTPVASIIVVTDLESPSGKALAVAALQFLVSGLFLRLISSGLSLNETP